MRRKDREMSEEFAWGVLDRCEYAFLSMTRVDGTPYCIPITIARDGQHVYFHSAMAGEKVTLLRQSPQVCLTAAGNTEIIQEEFTTRFESAVACGRATEILDQDEKLLALRLICQRHTPDAMGLFTAAVQRSLPYTAIFRIDVTHLTGKAKR